MKKNIRKIVVNEKVYFYKVASGRYGDDQAIVILTIYLEGHRHTPYIFHFKSIDHYYAGAPLNAGVLLLNHQTALSEVVNINRPYYIRLCILKALEQGWDASKMQINEVGMQFLTELNLDISKIEVKT